MKRLQIYNILYVLVISLFASCSDEADFVSDDDTPVTFSARSEWLPGRTVDTRSIHESVKNPATLTPGWLYITAKDQNGNNADPASFLVKPADIKTDPDDPSGYTDYHGFYLKEGGAWTLQKKIAFSRGQAKNLKFTAYYYHENGVEPDLNTMTLPLDIPDFGSKDYMYSDAVTYPSSVGDKEYRDHILFDLKHRTALLRLYFKVASSYDKIRNIVLRKVSINDCELTITDTKELPSPEPGMLLTQSSNLFACTYINTTNIKAGTDLTFKCTYDIYDKDLPIDAEHCTRKGVTATNKVKLNSLPAPTITSLEQGKYYDLTITIDPDYLYVLSEHDNKMHLKIE